MISINKEKLSIARLNEISNAIQKMLDDKAKEYRYDNIMSVRSYAGYANSFQTEAQVLAIWAADCWAKAGEIEQDVITGKRQLPTVNEILAEMPTIGV